MYGNTTREEYDMTTASLARRSAVAATLALGLVLVGAQPSFGWSSSITYQEPWGCVGGSLVGQSYVPAPYEARSTSAAEGSCTTYAVLNGHNPLLTASLRYKAGGTTAPATTYGYYVTTTGWSHYSYYSGGRHTWGSVVVLNS